MGLFNIFKKDKDNKENQPKQQVDYSSIDSKEKAESLFAKNELAEIYIMPLELGGFDFPMNKLFVPEFVKAKKMKLDAQVATWVKSGHQINYSATPEYKGDSFIPSKLIIQTNGSQSITETIDIW